MGDMGTVTGMDMGLRWLLLPSRPDTGTSTPTDIPLWTMRPDDKLPQGARLGTRMASNTFRTARLPMGSCSSNSNSTFTDLSPPAAVVVVEEEEEEVWCEERQGREGEVSRLLQCAGGDSVKCRAKASQSVPA